MASATSLLHAATWPFLAMACALASAADTSWQVRIEARALSRSSLVPADGADRIRQAGTLGGGPKDCCIAGWVDYDFGVPQAGWYELFALEAVSETEFIVDPSSPAAYAYGTASIENGMAKIANAWLGAGTHTLRAQRYFWTGLPVERVFEVEPRDRDHGYV